VSFKPPPSRLELIRLRRQLALFQRMKKTLEDARNSTIQRIRALVADLERLRREIADGFVEVADNFKIAVAKSGIDKIENIAELTPKTVRVELVNRGTHIGLEVSNYVTYPTYSIATEAAELDIALVKMRELLTKLIEFAEKGDALLHASQQGEGVSTHDKRHRLRRHPPHKRKHAIYPPCTRGGRKRGVHKEEDNNLTYLKTGSSTTCMSMKDLNVLIKELIDKEIEKAIIM